MKPAGVRTAPWLGRGAAPRELPIRLRQAVSAGAGGWAGATLQFKVD